MGTTKRMAKWLAGIGAAAVGVVAAGAAIVGFVRRGRAPSPRARGAGPERPRDFAHISRLAVVGELTAAIAHEINQPLGAILSNADAGEMLLDRIAVAPDAAALAELRHILADIRRDGLRASGVIRHVRTLAGRRELAMQPVDAHALATETVRLLEPDMRRRGIRIEAPATPCDAWLLGDRAYLEQVLINLLLNAMDAQDAVGATTPILLDVDRASGGTLEFRVVDRGAGIPVERLGKLFHSFYSAKPHGMGLGLSIARSIVEAHGGRIAAENNAGGGATFRIAFPSLDAAT